MMCRILDQSFFFFFFFFNQLNLLQDRLEAGAFFGVGGGGERKSEGEKTHKTYSKHVSPK